MSDKRDSVYFLAKTGVYLKLNLDPDLYNATTRTKIGAEAAKPSASGDVIIPTNIKYAVASGVVKAFVAKCEFGSGDAVKTRRVPLLVHSSKVDTISSTDQPATLLLGQGATPKTWNVTEVVSK